jgi:hypothetical protein
VASVEDDPLEEAIRNARLESAIDWACRKIKNAGWHVTKVHRIYPPSSSRETEVLFRGRKLDKTGPPKALVAYIPDDPNGAVEIEEGW